MLSLRDLSAISEFGLNPVVGTDREVHRALILSGREWIGADIANALIVANAANLQVVDRLLATLAAGGAAGLAVAEAPDQASIAALRRAAEHRRFPLLTSTRPLSAWRSGLAQSVLDLGADRARRHAARLAELIGQLKTSHDAVEAISRLLADELDAEVVVRGADGILAAVPPAAPLTLASVIQRPDRPLQTTPAGLFAGTVHLSADQVLIVATKEPAGRADREIVKHAATALTFALAPRPRQTDTALATAVRSIQLSAFQLLMTGNTTHARRVMAGITPGLLDSESARVFVMDCARADRETVMAEVERSFQDRALAVRCPAYHEHIIVLVPEHPGTDGEHELRTVRQAFGTADVAVGGSPVRPLEEVGDGYRGSGRRPVPRGSPPGAHGHHLVPHPRPGGRPAGRRPYVGRRVPRADPEPAASRAIDPGSHRDGTGVPDVRGGPRHRRAPQHDRPAGQPRVRRDRDQPGPHARPHHALPGDPDRRHTPLGAPGQGSDVSLHGVLSHPQVRGWADRTLRPPADDRRDLIRTLRTWVLTEFNADAAAARLGIAAKTVRAHIHAAEPLLAKDLITGLPQDVAEEGEQRLSGLRTLTVALYATTPPGGAHPTLPGDPLWPAPGAGGFAASR